MIAPLVAALMYLIHVFAEAELSDSNVRSFFMELQGKAAVIFLATARSCAIRDCAKIEWQVVPDSRADAASGRGHLAAAFDDRGRRDAAPPLRQGCECRGSHRAYSRLCGGASAHQR